MPDAGTSGRRAPLPRVAGLDVIKGVAVTLVVVIHAAPPLAVNPPWYRDHVVEGVARLAVPVFLVVTGFLAGLKQTSRARFAAYFRKFLGLHLGYAAFYWMVEIAKKGVPENLDVGDVAQHFIAGTYAGQYYFAILLQVFFLGAFVLPAGFWRSPIAVAASAVASAAGIAVLSSGYGLEPGSPWLWVHRMRENPFWLWMVYVALGGFLGARALEGRLSALVDRPLVPVALGALGVALAVLDLPPPLSHPYNVHWPYARPSILVGSLLVALCVPALARLPGPAPARALGADSFGIFVLNPIVLLLLSLPFGRPQTPAESWLFVAGALVMAFGLTRLLRRYAPVLLA